MAGWGTSSSTGAPTTSSNGWGQYGEYAKILADLYKTYQSTKGPTFTKAPEDPSLTALRKKMLGYVDNSPTRNMIGSMIGSRLEANQQNGAPALPPGANGYNPYPNGYKAPQYDLKAIMGSMSTPQNPTPQANSAGPQGEQIPPPPPDVSGAVNDARHSRKKTALKSTLGGLVGGALGGVTTLNPYGVAAGAVGGEYAGMQKGKQTNQQKWDAAWQPFNDWKAQWGSFFGNHIPQNMKEYQAWYQQKYGRPYTAGA